MTMRCGSAYTSPCGVMKGERSGVEVLAHAVEAATRYPGS